MYTYIHAHTHSHTHTHTHTHICINELVSRHLEVEATYIHTYIHTYMRGKAFAHSTAGEHIL